MPELFFTQQLVLLVVGIVLTGIVLTGIVLIGITGIIAYHYRKKADCETLKRIP